MITREKASEVIYEIINSGIISDGLEDALRDIESCIRAEDDWHIHAWGMPDEEYICLCTAMRTDLPEYKEFIKKQARIVNKYSFSEGEK